jgi:hypothetical protein
MKKKPDRKKWGEPGSRVKRVVRCGVWSKGKTRPVVVSIYPDGVLGLRLLGTKREEFTFADDIYRNAVTTRVAFERAAKKKARKAR